MAYLSEVEIDNTSYDVKSKVANSVPIATVDSTSTSTAFTVQVEEFANETALRDGMFFWICNNVIASASGNTLNVNGFGAKPIYNPSLERVTTGFAKNRYFPCWYDSTRINGGCWIIGYLTDTNTTYSTFGNLVHSNNNNSGFLAHSAVYRYQLLFQVDDTYATPLNNNSNSTGTGKTMLTNVEFDPFGEILYWYSTGTVAKDANLRPDYAPYAINALDLRYTFNCGSTLTARKPVYLQVALQSSGKVKIANTMPIVQSLPTTDDGLLYIFLGRTYSTYQMALYPKHPVYRFNGTEVEEVFPNTYSKSEIDSMIGDIETLLAAL